MRGDGGEACLSEESDGFLLQLLGVADVAVNDAVEVQACPRPHQQEGHDESRGAALQAAQEASRARCGLTRGARRLASSLNCFFVHDDSVSDRFGSARELLHVFAQGMSRVGGGCLLHGFNNKFTADSVLR
jgi:hypothetical protein